MMLAVANVLIKENLYDKAFVEMIPSASRMAQPYSRRKDGIDKTQVGGKSLRRTG